MCKFAKRCMHVMSAGKERLVVIVTVGIGLAKSVPVVHDVDELGTPAVVCPSVPRVKRLELVAALSDRHTGLLRCPAPDTCQVSQSIRR